jgi:hypothetical protein
MQNAKMQKRKTQKAKTHSSPKSIETAKSRQWQNTANLFLLKCYKFG